MNVDVIQNLNSLLPEEVKELQSLHMQWGTARRQKDWIEADYFREKLKLWDTSLELLNDGLWQPSFEHNLNRQKRAFIRMNKYKVRVYPWELQDAA